jgi:nitroreductase
MNTRLKLLFARRSVRRYTAEDVTDADLHDLLEAAMSAPSAVARDPWHFISIRERATLTRLAEILPNGQMLRQAPLAIIACGDLKRAHQELESYMLQDCSAAVENLLVAAAALGLGACWLGVHPRTERIDAIRALCALPAGIVPVAAIALGHPAEHPEPRTRWRADAVHCETW